LQKHSYLRRARCRGSWQRCHPALQCAAPHAASADPRIWSAWLHGPRQLGYDLEGGARFGYGLLWVLVLSNFMAILLQTLASRLGIVAKRDLAQRARIVSQAGVRRAVVLCEIAIAACDLAEVLGAAIGLHLLFGIPLVVGVALTALDTVLVLWFSHYGIRVIEAIILLLIAVMTACFAWNWRSPSRDSGNSLRPDPHLNGQSLYWPSESWRDGHAHNLYLHSALVQTAHRQNRARKARGCWYNLADSVLALNGALLVNAAILIMAAGYFSSAA